MLKDRVKGKNDTIYAQFKYSPMLSFHGNPPSFDTFNPLMKKNTFLY